MIRAAYFSKTVGQKLRAVETTNGLVRKPLRASQK
jgi:hypothetical protein